jgi:hypothetical protein
LNPQKLLQEFTDQITVDEATKAKPVVTQPTSVKPNSASPVATPPKTVTQPAAAVPAPPPATLSNGTPVPISQPVSNQESQVAPVGDGVVER